MTQAEASTVHNGAKVKFEVPPRPAGLQKTIFILYGSIVAVIFFFALVGETMRDPVAEGKFRKLDGAIIDIADFDSKVSGPFPKCHPHHKEYELVDNVTGKTNWKHIDSAPSSGPFPAGHPENPEWKEKWDQVIKQRLDDNKFKWIGIHPNLHLLLLACLCVTLGSKLSAWDFTHVSNVDGESGPPVQLLQSQDAYWFPVMGSVTLFSLFLVYKYLGSETVKFCFSCFVTLMCVHGLALNIDEFAKMIGKRGKIFLRIEAAEVDCTPAYIGGFIGASFMCGCYLAWKNWIINNMFGLSFCIMGIRKIGLSDYKTGAIMLVGLFWYDVFWVFGSKAVFGSNVMVTVAKGVEAPIKLMFPRGIDGCGNFELSMLGLGDIVVPGLFTAFLAKFDVVVMAEGTRSPVYLTTTMVAYVLSLVVTVGVMLVFNAAQPALLYIVPFVLIASAGLACFRGEWTKISSYTIDDGSEDAVAAVDEKKDN